MSTIRVAIAGATGYSGEELIRLLLAHPHVQLTCLAASAKWERPVPVSEIFPRFAGQCDLPVSALDPSQLAQSCDVAFLALPHGVSLEVVPTLLKAGRKVIDLAGDFRLKDAAAFAHWYGKPHTQPVALSEAVYGIAELARDAVAKARLIANPGCYATSVILAAAPLVRAFLAQPDSILVDAKSGITGAGRKNEAHFMFGEMDENMWAYKVNQHQQVPEIEQALTPLAHGKPVSLCFVPHVVPLNRGILSTVFLRTTEPLAWEAIHAVYREFYRQAPFVRIRPKGQWPRVRDVEGSNYCDLAFTTDEAKRLVIVSAAIDNLMKGAAGQAVQNFNLMHGFPETTGLR